MIYKLARIGTHDENDGVFLINDSVNVKYTQIGDDVDIGVNFEASEITEDEAFELAFELLRKSKEAKEALLESTSEEQ